MLIKFQMQLLSKSSKDKLPKVCIAQGVGWELHYVGVLSLTKLTRRGRLLVLKNVNGIKIFPYKSKEINSPLLGVNT